VNNENPAKFNDSWHRQNPDSDWDDICSGEGESCNESTKSDSEDDGQDPSASDTEDADTETKQKSGPKALQFTSVAST
jgi:hypothetical protein